jgi:hypothetical protein
MFEHIVHLQSLHINWGATEVGRPPHAWHGSSTSQREALRTPCAPLHSALDLKSRLKGISV